MSKRAGTAAVAHFIHEHLLLILLGSYGCAGVLPNPGLWLRALSVDISPGQNATRVSLPLVMLGFLLFNAGLGVETSQLRRLARSPLALVTGLAANVLVPVSFIWGVSHLMSFWHNADEVQYILVGLALVAAMPIAGSATAWTQNANGDLALSLALVLCSTFLSPLTTPLTFDLVEHMASGQYAQALEELETVGAGFMGWIIVPSLLGILARWLLGQERVTAVRPLLKLANFVNLLLLNYSNAAVSLPQVVAEPDWDFLMVVLGIVVCLCVLTFTTGWFIGRVLHVDLGQRLSLTFALGMNNNGTGLVLASLALADFPQVMLPIIFYNLVQHLGAGCVDHFLSKPEAEDCCARTAAAADASWGTSVRGRLVSASREGS
jgi:BASS family bile acid:Na+ symporter